MNNDELKNYTSKIKEIEMALYTEQQLQKEHLKYIHDNMPKPPARAYISAPKMPQKEDFSKEHSKRSIWTFLFVCFMSLMLLLWAVILVPLMIINHSFLEFPFENLFFGCIGIGCFLYFKDYHDTKKKENENDLNAMALYEKAIDEYNHKMNDYYSQVDKEKEQYLKKLDEYNKEILPEYETKVDDIVREHNSIYLKLKNALDTLYSENIIYPKYRNLIAISAINEYLMSGRCYELEGPNGAYNLYEMELRHNLIIDKLSDIVSDLGKIKSNQFSLYESLQYSNTIIKSIMNEMKNLNKTSNLIAYYARVTALAESVPKFIIGYTKSIN